MITKEHRLKKTVKDGFAVRGQFRQVAYFMAHGVLLEPVGPIFRKGLVHLPERETRSWDEAGLGSKLAVKRMEHTAPNHSKLKADQVA